MELQREFFVGVVEDNKDPNRKGRIKVRVLTLYEEIDIENIPYAFPFAGLAGKEFQVPAIGKLVNVLFLSNDLYSPYYIYSENYNTNLKNKLEDLSEDEYVNFVALLFDERTNIFADSEELTIDHLFNKMTINNSSINHELKDNTQILNLGAKGSEQDAVLGTNFFEWMDKFIEELNTPSSLIGNIGAPIMKPIINKLCLEYKSIRNESKRYLSGGFVSKNVKIVENTEIPKLERTPKEVEYRKNDITLDGEIDGLLPSYGNKLNTKFKTINPGTTKTQKDAKEKLEKQNKESCKKGKKTKPSSYIEPDEDMKTWILPLTGSRISSKFGLRKDPTNPTRMEGHNGIDIVAPTGTKIVSPADGKVIGVNETSKGGKYIKIRHDNGFVTGYAHLSEQKVKKNQKVTKGETIGLVGNTGAHTTGPHLHFTVTTPADDKVDPELYFTWPDSHFTDTTKKNKYQEQPYTTDGDECEGEETDSEPDYNPEGDPLDSEPDDKKFEEFCNLIIDNIEGGYYHKNMFDDGRLRNDPATKKLYKKSGETMFGIDRKNFGKRTEATKEFWKVIDDADAKNKWKWNSKGGKYNKELKKLVVKIMKPRFDKYFDKYILTDEAKEIVANNDKIYFNFVYATWNGPGRFRDHGKLLDDALTKGIKDAKKLSSMLLNARLNSKHTLIVNSGKKMKKIYDDNKVV